MDHGIVVLQELVAREHGRARALLGRELLRRQRELGRPHLLGGRVDEVAGQVDRAREPLGLRPIRIRGPDQLRGRAARRLVAGEGITAERPSQRHARRRRATRSGVERVLALRQGFGQRAQRPDRLLRVPAHQDTAEPSRGRRHQRRRIGLRLEPKASNPAPLELGEVSQSLGQAFRCYGRDRDSVGSMGDECYGHRQEPPGSGGDLSYLECACKAIQMPRRGGLRPAGIPARVSGFCAGIRGS